ncbi:MAG: tRNA nucleotidyltransferase [Dehalococcoidia bacterium]|nr:tRNA nucleotidyltransferase [Dehalococcoidia bacterium]
MEFLQLLEATLSPRRVALLRSAGQIAHEEGIRVYLVGGAVRDLLLGRPVKDLDLVVMGDAVTLAYAVARKLSGQVVARSQFSTAKVKVEDTSLDLTTARRERYPRPGALPQIAPGTMEEDLARRDFSINAMAFPLHQSAPGQVLDFHGGEDDLRRGLIRVLHERSFVDDATRILRAVRYEQRLGFHLEESTEALLRRDLPMLSTISGDRLRKELQACLRERQPARLLLRLGEMGVMAAICPPLDRSGETIQRAMGREGSGGLGEQVYVGLLACSLTAEEGEQAIARLRMPSRWAAVVRDTIALRDRLPWLSRADLSPAQIYDAIAPFTIAAVEACALAAPNEEARHNLALFLDKLRYVESALSGGDLIALGIHPGPAIGEMLSRLRRARLEGAVTSRSEEVAMVKSWLASGQH